MITENSWLGATQQMAEFVSTSPTARKRHTCDLCGWAIMPGERYWRSVGFEVTAWTQKFCLWCERTVAWYTRHGGDYEWEPESLVEWLEDEYPTVYRQILGGWRYPDGERLPLPFQFRCFTCGILMEGYRIWCDPCDQARIEKLDRQLHELVSLS